MTKKEILTRAVILSACGLGAFTSYHFVNAKNHKEKQSIEQEKEIDENKIFVINQYLSKMIELPEEVKIKRSTPVYGEVTYTLPKEYENVYFLRRDYYILKDEMKIVETEDGISYTIYDDLGASRIFEIVIPTNNFAQKEESELSLTRKQENK